MTRQDKTRSLLLSSSVGIQSALDYLHVSRSVLKGDTVRSKRTATRISAPTHTLVLKGGGRGGDPPDVAILTRIYIYK